MKFAKLQATGNDFVVIDARSMERDWSQLAVSMCHRHLGVGADGLLLIVSSNMADFGMRMFNPDGSEAEACGNGLRCFAKYVIENGLASNQELRVETLAGIRKVQARVENHTVISVQVHMGKPRFAPADIPVLVKPVESSKALDTKSIVDYRLSVEGKKLEITCVSMGNPHAVAFLDRRVVDFPLAELGPKVEHHPVFPEGVNFEVANVLNRKQITARVWERGAGETLSCGSGACAIAVAAQLHGYTDSPVDITFPGGTLTVAWDMGGEVLLTGGAELVFTGEWPE